LSSLLGLLAFPALLRTLIAVVGFILLYILTNFLQMTVLDAFIFFLARWKPVRRFLGLGWTRRFRRYTAPGFKPLEPL
jgi:hypothetical protein